MARAFQYRFHFRPTTKLHFTAREFDFWAGVSRTDTVEAICELARRLAGQSTSWESFLVNWKNSTGKQPEYLGQGVSRKTYALNEALVIKFAKHPTGDEWGDQNAQEYENSTEYPELTPKVYLHETELNFLISERVQPLASSEFHPFADSCFDNEADEERYEELRGCFSDLHAANLGRRADGTLVAIDAGL